MGNSTDTEAALRRRTWVAAIAVLIGIGIAGSLVWRQRPRLELLEISPQTSYLLQPTNAEGWIDYAAAVDWMRRASLDGGGANAAEPLMRALGPIGVPTGSGRDARAVLDRWRPEARAPAETSELQALPNGGQRLPVDDLATGVDDWLRARCPARGEKRTGQVEIFAWLDRSDAALANLLEASRAKGLYVPTPRREYGNVFQQVNPYALADATGVMGCAAAAKLLRGDPAGSWANLDAMWKLGLVLGRWADVTGYHQAMRVWEKALRGTVDLAASSATTVETLLVMQKSMKALAEFPSASEPLLLMRLWILADLSTPLMQARPPRTEAGLLTPVGFRGGLVEMNEQFDALDAALQLSDPMQRLQRLEHAIAGAGKTDHGSRWMLQSEVRARSSRRLATVALALALRQRETGKLPASLAELGDLPTDPGGGGPFLYVPEGRQFSLRGVGADGRDDGGDPKKDVVIATVEPPRLPAP